MSTIAITMCRMVQYHRHGSPDGTHKPEPSPAVVVQVLDQKTEKCRLFVMNPNGLYFTDAEFSEKPKPGCWSWPSMMPAPPA